MADRFSLDEIKDLFRDDVARFITSMRVQLARLLANPLDSAAVDQLRGAGHSLKGSAGLVDLTYLSQVGDAIDRLGERAHTAAQSDVHEALTIFRQTQRALPIIERLVENCLLRTDPEAQENLYIEFTQSFTAPVRRALHAAAAPVRSPRKASKKQSARSFTQPPDPLGPTPEEADSAWSAQLGEIFFEELRENLGRVPPLVAQLTLPTARQRAYYDLSRVFHTIKGSAAMVGHNELSALGKHLQDAFGAAADGPELSPEALPAAQSALDALFAAAELEAPELAIPSAAAADAVRPALSDLDRELLDAFTIDAREAIEASERLLLELERQPEDRNQLQALFRHFHTLKGAAAAVGLDIVTDQLHHGESLLDAVLNGEVAIDGARLVDFLFRLTDSVTGLINEARGAYDRQRAILDDVPAEIAALTGSAVPAGADIESALRVQPAPAAAMIDATEATTVSASEPDAGTVRIQASRLDTLMNQVTQLVVSRTRLDRKIEAFGELRDKLDYCRGRLAELIQGFQENYEYTIGNRAAATPLLPPKRPTTARNLRDIADEFFTDLEFDKYDDVNILARSVIELATDTGEITDQLGRLIDSFGDDSRQFSKVTSGLQRQITRLRLVTLDTVYRRLARPVRDAARHEGKLVDLQFEGADVQLDKATVEALHAPLLHLVRNAVSHGIEAPAARQAIGKPTAGTIRIIAQPRHNSVLLEVHDDGAGIDFDAILAKGRALGLVGAGVAPTRDQLIPLIFRPGFSTGGTVTDLAGRGVGMDVVARDIAALNGSLLVDSKDRAGTSVRMVLPTMTTIDEVLLLQVGTQQYAIAADFVDQALALDMTALVEVEGQRMLQVRNELLPVLLLGPLADQPPPASNGMALVLRAGDRVMALAVDRIEPQREVVIRPLGRILEAHQFLSGATISGDGTVIFTLHVGRLFDVLAAEASHQATFILGAASDAIPVEARAVLVVDDSISVRKLAARFLETEGLEVDTAVDGLDALDKLASGRFRLVVTDLEMPRMHGYELIAEIRHLPRLQHLPVIVCSSRSSEKHRRRASEVGAQGYITKPFTKEQLLAEMQRVSPDSTPPRSGIATLEHES